MKKTVPGLVLLLMVNGVSAVEGTSWEKVKNMSPHKLVTSGYRLVSTSHLLESGTYTEYLYFQKENSLYRCLNTRQSSGEKKVKCGVLVDPRRK